MPAVALALAALACAPPAMLLRDFRVVCVSPCTPGNVGMIARAIANFEAGGLTIVAPDYDRETTLSLPVALRVVLSAHRPERAHHACVG